MVGVSCLDLEPSNQQYLSSKDYGVENLHNYDDADDADVVDDDVAEMVEVSQERA